MHLNDLVIFMKKRLRKAEQDRQFRFGNNPFVGRQNIFKNLQIWVIMAQGVNPSNYR
jgi:hypothetical protein